jgi:hypothetical protein
MQRFKIVIAIFWYGLALYLGLVWLQGPLWKAWTGAHDFVTWLSLLKAVLGLLLLVTFFIAVHVLSAARGPELVSPPDHDWGASPPSPASGRAFPFGNTIPVGVWLLLLTGFLLCGLFAVLCVPFWPDSWFKKILFSGDDSADYLNALVSMLAAGVGSMITAILGYLEHASEKKDFERAYTPWYVGRPLMGSLLGLVFYFLMRGGLLATTGGAVTGTTLKPWALAGIGAMVGMFSKNAIEKLQEIFNTLFSKQQKAPANTGGTSSPP